MFQLAVATLEYGRKICHEPCGVSTQNSYCAATLHVVEAVSAIVFPFGCGDGSEVTSVGVVQPVTAVAVGDGTIELTATWREEWVVNPDRGYTHGGILATLVDLTADWAMVSKTGRGVPTVDLRVDYHRAAMPGVLTVRGEIVNFGRQFSVAEAKVFDHEGRLLASGRGTYLTAPPA